MADKKVTMPTTVSPHDPCAISTNWTSRWRCTIYMFTHLRFQTASPMLFHTFKLCLHAAQECYSILPCTVTLMKSYLILFCDSEV